MKRITILLLCLFCAFANASFATIDYVPRTPEESGQQLWISMSADQAGEALLNLRAAGKVEDFAVNFKLLLDEGRTASEILRILRIVGLPFSDEESEAISQLVIDSSLESILNNIHKHGYSLEAYSSNRLELVFLNESERLNHVEAVRLARESGTSIASHLTPEIEGRMCVWTPERKIHLGGDRVSFSTAARILSSRIARDNPLELEQNDAKITPIAGGNRIEFNSRFTFGDFVSFRDMRGEVIAITLSETGELDYIIVLENSSKGIAGVRADEMTLLRRKKTG